MNIRMVYVLIALIVIGSQGFMVAQVPVHHVQDACVKIRAEAVSTFPPISQKMPPDVMHAYVVMDSLCRVGSERGIDSLLSTMAGDTLSLLMQRYYEVIDYDPILFMEYARASKTCASYQIDIPTILVKFLDAYHRVHQYEGHEELFIWTNYIYRIRVLSQSSRLDSSHKTIFRHFCANVEVLEKIKGSVLPDPSRQRYSGGDSGEAFMNILWGQDEGGQKGATIWDTARYVAVREGYLVPGNEYLVFIDALPVFLNETDVGYLLGFSGSLTKANSFAYPVQSGNVIDAEGYFGDRKEIPYDTFVKRIRAAKSSM